jgi:sugar (pentulose or hexulose) kinase
VIPATIALDLGSTTFKVRAFDTELRTLAEAASPLRYRYAEGGRVELAPAEVDRALAAALKAVLGGLRGATPAAVAVTSQAQTFAVHDGQRGFRTAFVSWMDSRARDTAAELARLDALAAYPRHASFGALLPGLTICILDHLVRADPGLLAGGARVTFLASHVLEALTGVTAVDDNLAAMSGLYSLELRDWWPPALERCRLEPHNLPRVVPVGTEAGRTSEQASRWGLPAGLPVVSAGNDQTAGAYGCGVHRDGSLLVTLGTAQVAYTAASALPEPDPRLFRGPYPGGRFYRAAVDDGGGSVVEWACSVLAGCATPRDLFVRAAEAPPGARGARYAAGRWEGLGPGTGTAELARSILEHLVTETAAVVRRVEPAPGTRKTLVAGGGSREPLWVDLLSRELGAELVVTEADPLRGAALLARELRQEREL